MKNKFRGKVLPLVSGFLLTALMAASPTAALADAIDPQVWVCTGCTSSPTPNDPVFINASSINIGFAGSHSAVAPLLVIVGVPNDASATGPTISLPSGVSLSASGTYYGAATNHSATGERDGTFTSGSPDAYNTVGIANSGGGHSESFGNWTGSPFPNGNPNPDAGVTNFGLFVYAINYALDNTGDAGQNSPINIGFSGIPLNSYVIAYNCATSGSKCSGGDIGVTPFTVSGFVTDARPHPPTVPEPTSLLLMGSGLVGMAKLWAKRRANR